MYSCNVIKKRLWYIFFPTSFAKYLGRVFLYIIATVSDFSCSSNRVTFSKPSQTSMMKLFCWNRWPMCKIPKLHQIPWCINLRIVSAEFRSIRTKLCTNCTFRRTFCSKKAGKISVFVRKVSMVIGIRNRVLNTLVSAITLSLFKVYRYFSLWSHHRHGV